mmetsp:Transcript_62256/g.144856  ORF Transcript_62256/g.144856 Transcript_62256/m.144856 type:complete len:105 (-) Transcript_62256:220-534(-)
MQRTRQVAAAARENTTAARMPENAGPTGISALATRIGEGIGFLVPWGAAEPDARPSASPQVAKVSALKVVEALCAQGFSRAQALEASKRCSSVEAAVDWILAHS